METATKETVNAGTAMEPYTKTMANLLENNHVEGLVSDYWGCLRRADPWRQYLISLCLTQTFHSGDLSYLHRIFNIIPSQTVRLMSRGSIANLVRRRVRGSPESFATSIKNASCMFQELIKFWTLGNRRKILQMRVGLDMFGASLFTLSRVKEKPRTVLFIDNLGGQFDLDSIQVSKVLSNYRAYLYWERAFFRVFRGKFDYWRIPLLGLVNQLGFEEFGRVYQAQMEVD